MVDMAIPSGAGVVVEPPTVTQLGDTPETNASIAAYLGAGERMQTLMDLTWKTCAVLLALIIVAWALGMLPVAVKLF